MNRIENFVEEKIMPQDKNYYDENEFYDENELRSMGYKSVGADVRVSKVAVIKYPELVSIGNHVAIDPFTYISTQMEIGNYVHIAIGVAIIGSIKSKLVMEDYTFIASHSTLVCGTDDYTGEGLAGPTIPVQYRKTTFGTITLKKYSGTGAHVVIMPNVVIGEGTVIGACGLVTKSLDPWGIYIGMPVKRIKDRKRELIVQYVGGLERI
jgi:acetyltransferase-like isoleucine patch superfamily enzyme